MSTKFGPYFILLLIILFPSGCNFSGQSNLPGIDNSEIAAGEILIVKPAVLRSFINNNISLKKLHDSLHLDISEFYVEIIKHNYTLSVCCRNEVIKQYPVVFGNNPENDKLRAGDYCTPEGTFRVLSKYPHSNWSKFIWIDYPNAESLVKIKQAKESGLIPENASPGGEIGIHGTPEERDNMVNERRNWTAGCISMKRKDVNEVYSFVTTGTKVIIKK